MINIKRLHKDAIEPKYSTFGSSAFDLFCYEDVVWEITSNHNWVALVNTGWAFDVPNDYGMFILSRSGHGFKNLTTLGNSVGLLDSDYSPLCKLDEPLYTGTCKHFKPIQRD